MFKNPLSASILPRAQKNYLIDFEFINLRDFGIGPRKQVDDTPYGGGAGMVLRVDVMAKAIAAAKAKSQSKKLKVILLTPQGIRFNQEIAQDFAESLDEMVLICGHYEGFDERIRTLVDEEISIGDYILTGGEIPAMVLIDAIGRLLPGVLGSSESLESESFSGGHLIEYPHYTRPNEFGGQEVPAVLLSGNHAAIEKWRHQQSEEKTKNRLKKDNRYC